MDPARRMLERACLMEELRRRKHDEAIQRILGGHRKPTVGAVRIEKVKP